MASPKRKSTLARTRNQSPKSTQKNDKAESGPINALPLDIIREIACHLRPLDILQLSRLNNTWRNTLMSREAASHIWRAARGTISGLPDCPEDLSEAEYASLLFETNCELCDQVSYKVDMGLGRRVCESCASLQVFSRSLKNFPSKLPVYDCDETILPIIPRSEFDVFGVVGPFENGPFYFAMDVYETIASMAERRRTLGARKYREWYQARVAFTDAAARHARVEQEWYQEWVEGQCSSRKASLEEKFQALGHRPQDIHWSLTLTMEHVSIPRELEHTEWERLRRVLEGELFSNRKSRIAKEARMHLAQRQTELRPLYHSIFSATLEFPPDLPLHEYVFPTRADFFNFTCIQPLLDDLDVPIGNVEQPDLETLRRAVLNLYSNVKRDVELALSYGAEEDFPGPAEGIIIRSLIALTNKKTEDSDQYPSYAYPKPSKPFILLPELECRPATQDDSHFTKATNVLICFQCRQPLHWPTLLMHEHVRDKLSPTEVEEFRDDAHNLFMTEESRIWQPGLVIASSLGTWIMKGILEASGLDFETASASDLTKLNTFDSNFRCLCCSFRARSWKHFFTHFAHLYRMEARAMLEDESLARKLKRRQLHNPMVNAKIVEKKKVDGRIKRWPMWQVIAGSESP